MEELTKPVKGTVSNAIAFDDVEESRNRILPRLLENGKGIPVILSKLPALVYVGENLLPALKLEFFSSETEAYADMNVLLPKTTAESDEEKKMQKGGAERLKHVLNAFINTEGLTGNTYEEIALNAIKRVTPELLNTPCEIKLVYNKKGMISFPTVGNCISTNLKKKSFEWNAQFDKHIAPEKSSGALTTTVDVNKMSDMM